MASRKRLFFVLNWEPFIIFTLWKKDKSNSKDMEEEMICDRVKSLKTWRTRVDRSNLGKTTWHLCRLSSKTIKEDLLWMFLSVIMKMKRTVWKCNYIENETISDNKGDGVDLTLRSAFGETCWGNGKTHWLRHKGVCWVSPRAHMRLDTMPLQGHLSPLLCDFLQPCGIVGIY